MTLYYTVSSMVEVPSAKLLMLHGFVLLLYVDKRFLFGKFAGLCRHHFLPE